MSTLSQQAEPAVAELIESDEDQLYEQLGVISKAIDESPSVAGSFDPEVVYDGEAMGPLDDLRELGLRIWRRWEKVAFELVCGDDEQDKEDRSALLDAFGIGGVAVAASLAAALTGVGLAPAIAAVVAAIVIKRFLRPTAAEFCTFWKEHLD